MMTSAPSWYHRPLSYSLSASNMWLSEAGQTGDWQQDGKCAALHRVVTALGFSPAPDPLLSVFSESFFSSYQQHSGQTQGHAHSVHHFSY